MNNSSVCTYTINGVTRSKKKYRTAEEAHKAAQKINTNPNGIYKFGEYKCTTCLGFHVGRTKHLLERKPGNVFQNEVPLPEATNETPVKTTQLIGPVPQFPIKPQTIAELALKEVEKTIEEVHELQQILDGNGADEVEDFDWDSLNKKQIKKVK